MSLSLTTLIERILPSAGETKKEGSLSIFLKGSLKKYMVNKNTMTGSGNLPKFEETLFSDKNNDLWFIRTG